MLNLMLNFIKIEQIFFILNILTSMGTNIQKFNNNSTVLFFEKKIV